MRAGCRKGRISLEWEDGECLLRVDGRNAARLSDEDREDLSSMLSRLEGLASEVEEPEGA